MLVRLIVTGLVLAANVLAGYLAVALGTSAHQVCVDTFTSSGSSGCIETGRDIDWGPFQLAVFAAMTTSLLCLGAYLVRGLRSCLIAALVLATAFVSVPAAFAVPKVFNDSGSVQLPMLGR